MINHVSIGVRDIAKTKRFYDAALKPLGYKCVSEGSQRRALKACPVSLKGNEQGSHDERQSADPS